MPTDKLRDRSRGFFSLGAFQNVSRHWQARAGLYWISDPRYFEDFNSASLGVSAYSLYSEAFATFDEDDVYDQKDSAGFINLFGLPIKVKAILDAEREAKA